MLRKLRDEKEQVIGTRGAFQVNAESGRVTGEPCPNPDALLALFRATITISRGLLLIQCGKGLFYRLDQGAVRGLVRLGLEVEVALDYPVHPRCMGIWQA